ncbi:aminoglycoside phosphotransferase family protein [Paenibacillus spongiae]|uniref:Aminoglycoside phosphotransferase family protein n=1 Tax=Paenibacillus spongiae TaxID=2909671 RepID=A0ABY5S1E4_9BACL|nr:aminoglycoside phosphotransferase family protein [Paenibacillus spongiae]UVI27263.1 aminoglycoside phosphotransferase family protein [Paenibacillus spongiae]
MLLDNFSNAVLFGTSRFFGDVVLKIGIDITSEIKAMSRFNEPAICRCYDTDESLGALLLERVMQGNDLTTISSEEDRITIAANLMLRLSVFPGTTLEFPTYYQWLQNDFNRVRRKRNVSEKMVHFMEIAEKLFQEIQVLRRFPKLLHGDLHHENILQDSRGHWKAIDPKGVIGTPCMESARFIVNQVWKVPDNEKSRSLAAMTKKFSDAFNESPRIIAIGAFIDLVLILCCMYENNDDPQDILQCFDECQIYIDFIATCS